MLALSLRSIKPVYRRPAPVIQPPPPQVTPAPPPPPVSHPPFSRRLPPEILDMIFQRAVAPSFLLDSSLIAGPSSPWCKARDMKLSLVLVSRDWYAAGIALLYKDVVFRRLNQIPALLETLEASPSRFGPLIKRISLDMFVSLDYGVSFSRHIQRIVDLCPNLEGITLSSPFPLPPNATLPELNPTLKHLKAGSAVSPTELFCLLQTTRKSLISLSIHVHASVEELKSSRTYKLPKLESLTIQIPPCGVDSWIDLEWILVMPKLQRLTIELLPTPDTAPSPLKWDYVAGHIITFCRQYPDLKFLDINPGFRRKPGDMRRILAACPKLEHVVVYNGSQLDPHPTIRWVDVCTSKMFGVCDDSQFAHDAALNRLRSSISRTTFPSLQGTRHIHICSPQFSSIATYLIPGCVTSPGDAFEFNFPGVYLRHDLKSIHTERHIDVGPIYMKPVSVDFNYDPIRDPDDAGSDGTSEPSERSLGRLRKRETRIKWEGDDDTSSCSSLSSDCTVQASLRDPDLFLVRTEPKGMLR
ncbi:hypothetical protein H0H87_011833 [Tephrocybe sp. NHM501043]|nr:hypothetical protein H0H87_011833 [Tephrocybe sp. NHM501043]